MLLRQIFDPYLAQYAYLVGCEKSGEALVIDPERDIDRYQQIAGENGLKIKAVAETHIHADFVSGAQEFSRDPNIHLYLSNEGGADWSYQWPHEQKNVHLLKDKDVFTVGNIQIEALHTPGHTPEHLSYSVTDMGAGVQEPMLLCTGDFLFVGDVGRPDLLESAAGVAGMMEPSARQLADSLRNKLKEPPDFLQILPGHGAGSACGKSLGAIPTSTLGYERRFNSSLKLASSNREAFLKFILSGQPEPPLYFARMKRVNRDGIPITGGVPKPPQVDVKTIAPFLNQSGIRFLDCRDDRMSFAKSHLKRAIHAPLHSPFFSTAAGSFLSDSDRILLVVESSKDVDLAVRQLFRMGYDSIEDWVEFSEIAKRHEWTESLARIDFPAFEASKALREGEIIDVRTSSEFVRGHIEGARSFPYTRMKDKISQLPRDRKLFIHCGTGRRAALAASFLSSEGFNVVHIDGTCSSCEKIAQLEGVTH